jgi:hypothetical protein
MTKVPRHSRHYGRLMRGDGAGFNVVAIYGFDEHNHLLMSAGRGLRNASDTNRFSWYIAYQITR